MRYVGGKGRFAQDIIAHFPRDIGTYVEPFMGGLAVAVALARSSEHRVERYVLADVEPSLVYLYRAVSEGWIPPLHVSREEHSRIREHVPPTDPLHGWAAHWCSWNCKRWTSFSMRNQPYFHVLLAEIEDLMRHDVEFLCASYDDLAIPDGSMVYCDPPYVGRGKDLYRTPFDSLAFFSWARELSARATVLVSEFIAPPDFRCVEQWDLQNFMSDHRTRVTEKLFSPHPL